jgi:hypothetical protein
MCPTSGLPQAPRAGKRHNGSHRARTYSRRRNGTTKKPRLARPVPWPLPGVSFQDVRAPCGPSAGTCSVIPFTRLRVIPTTKNAMIQRADLREGAFFARSPHCSDMSFEDGARPADRNPDDTVNRNLTSQDICGRRTLSTATTHSVAAQAARFGGRTGCSSPAQWRCLCAVGFAAPRPFGAARRIAGPFLTGWSLTGSRDVVYS